LQPYLLRNLPLVTANSVPHGGRICWEATQTPPEASYWQGIAHEAMMGMVKLNVKALKDAYAGKLR
jgi:hypothetical protein